MIDAEPMPETLSSRAAALFRAYRSGESARMGELVALLTPILWNAARAQRLDRSSAEDVVQSAWLALVRNPGSVEDPQALLGWLITTVRRESWRVAKRDGRAEPMEIEPDDVVTPLADIPEERVLQDDGDNRLWQHIARLPGRCQELLRVIAFADRPDYAAVAKALGMPVGSIGPTRGRCLAKLRTQLQNDPTWEQA